MGTPFLSGLSFSFLNWYGQFSNYFLPFAPATWSSMVLVGTLCGFAELKLIAWTAGYFTMQEILLSWIAMMSILIPLVIVPLRMAKIKTEDNTTYAILKFPFEIHAAWIMAASLVNANVLLTDLELSTMIQIKSLLPSSR
jgi:uncharacterized membrane protein YcgQ (UPF0703/DUF1980 family)